MKIFLSLLLLSATSLLLASSVYANADKLKHTLPQEWVDEKGLDIIRYAEYIDSLKLKHITPEMVLKPHFVQHRGVKNSLPPRHLWKNIAPTLTVIDQLTSRLGTPAPTIKEAYRSPSYNRAKRGRSKNQQKKNMVVKIVYSVPPTTVAKELRKMRSEGLFKGGVGVYKSFVHLDTRGYNADW